MLLRFEAKVNEDAPTDKTVDNKAALTVNNGVTPSNKVENEPPVIKPSKQDTQKDPTINIDGKTALLGDKVYYRVNIDAPGSPTPLQGMALGHDGRLRPGVPDPRREARGDP